MFAMRCAGLSSRRARRKLDYCKDLRVNLLEADLALPKLDVAGSNPVARSRRTADVLVLIAIINRVRPRFWVRQPAPFCDLAHVDMDGTRVRDD